MRIQNSSRGMMLAALSVVFATTAFAPARAESIDDKRARKEAEIPICNHKIGSLAVHEPDNHWWEGLGLASPEAVIKVLVMKSQCFTLLDRGRGFEAAQQSRAIPCGGRLPAGSNNARGNRKAA